MANITKVIKNGYEYSIGTWDMAYSDFNWVTKTWGTITLDLNSKIAPSANFTVVAPSTIKEWQQYILRVENPSTVYTMTLGSHITNPHSVPTTLIANQTQYFKFLAVWTDLELQPEGWTSNWDVVVSSQANNVLTTWTAIWGWTEANYAQLTKQANTIYYTY